MAETRFDRDLTALAVVSFPSPSASATVTAALKNTFFGLVGGSSSGKAGPRAEFALFGSGAAAFTKSVGLSWFPVCQDKHKGEFQTPAWDGVHVLQC